MRINHLQRTILTLKFYSLFKFTNNISIQQLLFKLEINFYDDNLINKCDLDDFINYSKAFNLIRQTSNLHFYSKSSDIVFKLINESINHNSIIIKTNVIYALVIALNLK